MKIKNLEFSNCVLSSGSMNWFGDGYFCHDLYKKLFPGFKIVEQTSFVAKTTTLHYNAGRMPWKDNFRPRELFPKCIKVYFFRHGGMVLNAVSLSGPGAQCLFDTDRWQNLNRSFAISFMAIGATKKERLKEAFDFVRLAAYELLHYPSRIWFQINVSCPNTAHDTGELAEEALEILELFQLLSHRGYVIDLKINSLMPLETIVAIEKSGLCDILTVSNTIPFGTPDLGIQWNKLFRRGQSPLSHLGGGGLSGAPILLSSLKKISQIRAAGVNMPIKGSGGILTARDVLVMSRAGVDCIEIWEALMIRPWNVRSIIETAEQVFSI
jgi:dihydroorotate dehydrogenase